MKEFRKCWQWLRDDTIAKEEQVMEMKDNILEYQILINEMKEENEGTIHILTPLNIGKRWVNTVGKCGGHMKWRPHIDKMIMEMLDNLTPPSHIQTNILSMACRMNPSPNFGKELPCL